MAGLSDDALDAVADAERDYLKKSTEARKNVLVARATLRGLAAATNATSAENATAVIEESGLGAKVKKLMPFGGSPKSNRDDALNALAEATKEQQVAELDYLGVVASHLPDDVARRRLGQLASEGRDGTLEGSLSDALSFLRNSTEAKRAYVLQFDGDPAASQTANLREEVTAVLKTADASRGDEVVLKLTTGGGTVTGYGLAAAQLLRLKDAGLKLTVCVEQVAASGGYMMACCGDRIIASPFAVLGVMSIFAFLALTGFPQILLITATVIVFGPKNGAFYSWLATMASATLTFGLGHFLGGRWVRRFGGERVQRTIDFIGRHGILASGLVRVVPSAPGIACTSDGSRTRQSGCSTLGGS